MLVGWDTANWKVINPLIEFGRMPSLQKMIEHSVTGNLTTLSPVLLPMLWTSISTCNAALTEWRELGTG